MKKCYKCNQTKPIEDYYVHKEMADGHLNKCKKCVKKDTNKRTIPRVCTECGTSFMATANEVKRRGGGATTCSRKCFYKKIPKIYAEKNKNMEMSYAGVHEWVKRELGKPNYCENCKSTTAKAYDWSNKSGKYKREINDWQRLCRKCHIKYDGHTDKWRKTVSTKHGWKVKWK